MSSQLYVDAKVMTRSEVRTLMGPISYSVAKATIQFLAVQVMTLLPEMSMHWVEPTVALVTTFFLVKLEAIRLPAVVAMT